MESLSIKEIAHAVNGKILCGDENQLITSVSTNSKNLEPGALFVPIIGEKVDAHDFIESVFQNGAVACFTSKHTQMEKERVYIAVNDTLEALQALGAYYRSKFNIPVVGITGSVGKTTTKEMIAAALATKFNVLKTEGNMNSQVGLPLMMLKFNREYEIAVIEMGMSEFGEMERLTPISRPEVAVMTNIGVSHIGQLKTRENIRKEKLNIINAFKEDSVLYINGNDELLHDILEASEEINKSLNNVNVGNVEKDVKNSHISTKIDVSEATYEKLKDANVVAFGTNPDCEYRAENIITINGETHFTLRNGKDDGEEIILQVLGVHNVYNALAALAVAAHYGIPATIAKEGLYAYKPIAMRGQIKEVHGITVIDDTYNASPDSMKGGIQVLLELDNVKRRIAVLADVLELGEHSYQCHYDVGAFIAEHAIDEVITIGKEAEVIAKAIKERKGLAKTNSFMSNEDAISYLKQTLKVGDGVLIKGSRSMRTDLIVNALLSEI